MRESASFMIRKKILLKFIFTVLTALFIILAPISTSFSSKKNSLNATTNIAKVELSTVHAFQLGDATIVTKTLAGTDKTSSPWVKKLYNTCRALLDIAAFVLLIVIAFMNILQKEMDTYAMKKMVPMVIYALIFGNLGLPLFAITSRMVDAIQQVTIFSPTNLTQIYAIIIGGAAGTDRLMILAIAVIPALMFLNAFSFCFFYIILLIPLVGVVIINFLMSFRPYVIYLGAALSPLAFAAMILPATQQWFKKWLGIVLPWLIFPVLISFMFYIAKLIPQVTPVQQTLRWNIAGNLISYILPYALKLGILYLAIRLPFTLEKDITGLVAKIGTWGVGSAWHGYGRMMGNVYDAWDNKRKDFLHKTRTQAFNRLNFEAQQKAKAEGREVTPEEYAQIRKQSSQEAKDLRSEKFDKLPWNWALAGPNQKGGLFALNPYGALDSYKQRTDFALKKGLKAYRKKGWVRGQIGGAEEMRAKGQEDGLEDSKNLRNPEEFVEAFEEIFKKVKDGTMDEMLNGPDKATRDRYRDLFENDQDAFRKLLDENTTFGVKDIITKARGPGVWKVAQRYGLTDEEAGMCVPVGAGWIRAAGRRNERRDYDTLAKDASSLSGLDAEAGKDELKGKSTEYQTSATRISPSGDPYNDPQMNEIDEELESFGDELRSPTEEIADAVKAALEDVTVKAQLDPKQALAKITTQLDSHAIQALTEAREGGGIDSAKLGQAITTINAGNPQEIGSLWQSSSGSLWSSPNGPIFHTFKKLAVAGVFKGQAETKFIQSVSESNEADVATSYAQKISPKVKEQDLPQLEQNISILAKLQNGTFKGDVAAEQEKIKTYFGDLGIGAFELDGKISLNPDMLQTAVSALKSPDFQANPNLAVGKVKLRDGYAQNAAQAVQEAARAAGQPQEFALQQSVNLRIDDTIRTQANLLRPEERNLLNADNINGLRQQLREQLKNTSLDAAPVAVENIFGNLVRQKRNQPRAGQPTPATPTAQQMPNPNPPPAAAPTPPPVAPTPTPAPANPAPNPAVAIPPSPPAAPLSGAGVAPPTSPQNPIPRV